MFVPQARIKLGHSRPVWCSGPSKKQSIPHRKLKWYEFTRMPYLIPNIVGSILGFIILCSGAVLCYIGYNPGIVLNRTVSDFSVNSSHINLTTYPSVIESSGHYSPLKSLAYVGPVLMGFGFFVLMVAVVLYCEIKDKFVQKIIPKRDITTARKSDIYDMVIEEFRKNYFRGIEVPIKSKGKEDVKAALPTLYKALSVSTPAILITPEVQRKWLKETKVTPKHKRRRFLSDHETWLKTSSMPNIRPKSQLSRIQRRLSRYSKLFIDKKDLQENQNSNNDKNDTYDRHNSISERRNSERQNGVSGTNNSESCFSNPAYRGSPTETIQLSDITTELIHESYEKTRPADVVVHMDPNESDSRGITEQRFDNTLDEQAYTNCSKRRNSDVCGKSHMCNTIPGFESPHIVITDCMDTDVETTPLQSPSRCKVRHNSIGHADISRPKLGPYRTCIGVFRSESCLHRIRNIVNKTEHGDGDNSSLDSLTLNEETMKYFE